MKPFVIVFGHEKGGTGKSTLCANLAVGLSYKLENANIIVIDLDKRQGSTTSFFKSRAKIENLSKFTLLDPAASIADSKVIAQIEDKKTLSNIIETYKNADILIFDTAGSHTNFSVEAIALANLLITPLTDSFLDIDAFMRVNTLTKSLSSGPYASVVFEQQQKRLLANKLPCKWSIVRNRVSPIASENAKNCAMLLEKIEGYIGCKVEYQIIDRVVYKETFSYGLSIFDLPYLTNITANKLKAHGEMEGFVLTYLDMINKELGL